MSQLKKYLDLRKKHEKELNDFPMKYTFSDEGLDKALKELDAKEEECTSIIGCGDVIRKKDIPNWFNMIKRHKKELDELMEDHDVAYEAFLYEMNNHEYAINCEGDADVLGCFGMSDKTLVEKGLLSEYRRAQVTHYKQMQKNGVI